MCYEPLINRKSQRELGMLAKACRIAPCREVVVFVPGTKGLTAGCFINFVWTRAAAEPKVQLHLYYR